MVVASTPATPEASPQRTPYPPGLLVPLALLATDLQWKARSSCGVTIESILADDAMTPLVTAANLVRIRDVVGRVVFEHIGDGQTATIAIPSGLRPDIYLLERDEVRSLLLVR